MSGFLRRGKVRYSLPNICFAILMVVFTMLLTACDSGVDKPDNIPAGYKVAEGNGVALALPAGWTVMPVSVADFQRTAAELAQSNPGMAARLEEMSSAIQQDTLRLAAYHEDGLTNVNITVEKVPGIQTTKAQAAATNDGLTELGYTLISSEEVQVNGEDAIRSDLQITLSRGDGSYITMRLVQFTLVVGSTAYSISFGTPDYRYAEMSDELTSIVSTFYTVD